MICTFHKDYHEKYIEILPLLIESAPSIVKLTAKPKVELLNIVKKNIDNQPKLLLNK